MNAALHSSASPAPTPALTTYRYALRDASRVWHHGEVAAASEADALTRLSRRHRIVKLALDRLVSPEPQNKLAAALVLVGPETNTPRLAGAEPR